MSVDRKRIQLGINPPFKTSVNNPLCVAEFVKFKMAGWSLDKIAKVYGLSEARISAVLCKNGFKNFYWIRDNAPKHCRRWSEMELALLRKSLKKGYSVERIHAELPHRSLAAIRKKCTEMTRHWITPEEQSERERMKEKQLRVCWQKG